MENLKDKMEAEMMQLGESSKDFVVCLDKIFYGVISNSAVSKLRYCPCYALRNSYISNLYCSSGQQQNQAVHVLYHGYSTA